jgi:hypothetical protein
MKNTLLAIAIQADGENPIGGMRPSFAFGDQFDSWWKSLFAALWGLAILVTLAFCIIGIAKMATAGDNPSHRDGGKKQAQHAGIALAALTGFGVIVSAIMVVAG